MDDFDSTIKIDKPHGPWGKHVDILTKIPFGMDKIRVNPNGEIISHELQLGKTKINLDE